MMKPTINYKAAYELKKQGYSLSDIMDRLNVTISYRGFQSLLWKWEQKLPEGERMQEIKPITKTADDNKPNDIKSEILKFIEKEKSIHDICERFKLTERVLKAHVEDIQDSGYNILTLNNTIKLIKNTIPEENNHIKQWDGEAVIRLGVVSDTHLCNKWQQITFLNHLYDIFEQEGIETVYHAGDLSDGYYKNRAGHIYELIDGMAGSDAQSEYIIKKYRVCDIRCGISLK